MLETTHITPRRVLSPLRGRTPSRERDHYRSRSSSYRPPYYRQVTADAIEHGHARYMEASEDRVPYPEREDRERVLASAAPVPWEGQQWYSG